MTLAASGRQVNQFQLLAVIKSVLIWSFVLAVCMIVIGFPVLVLVVSVGSLLAVTLHSILPMNGILYTAIGFLGIHVLGILAASTFLTLKGTHPQDVEWLRWLHGQENPQASSTYASCPLTCDIQG